MLVMMSQLMDKA